VVLRGYPELDEAIRAGHVRLVTRIPLSRGGLGAAPIALRPDEEIVARVAMPWDEDWPEGEAILIATREALPRLKLTADDPRLAGLARMLAREAARS